MALALTYYAEVTGPSAVTVRVELYQEGFGGAATEIMIGGLSEIYGDESDEIDEPLRRSQRLVTVFPADPAARNTVLSGVLADLRTIQSAAPRDWLLVHKEGGAEVWRGWVLPRHVRFRVHDGLQLIDILAASGLSQITGEYRDGAGDVFREHAAASVVLADLLSYSGHSLGLFETSLHKPAAETGDPLEVQIPRHRYWEQPRPSDALRVADRAQVLEEVLTAWSLSALLADGAWQLSYPGAHEPGATVTRREYDAAGAAQGTTTPAATVDVSSEAFVLDSDEETGLDPTRKSVCVYAFGPLTPGELANGGFERWAGDQLHYGDPGNDIPRAWTYSGTTDIARRFELRFAGQGPDDRFSLGMKCGVTTGAEEPTLPQQRSAVDNWMTQEVGQFGSGADSLRLRFTCLLDTITKQNLIVNSRVEGFFRLRLTGTVDTYWFDGSGWSTLTTAETRKVRISPFVDTPTVAGDRKPGFGGALAYTVDLPAFPEAGTLEIHLGQGAQPDLVVSSTDNTFFLLWDQVTLEASDTGDDGTGSRTYQVLASGAEAGRDVEKRLSIGDGPFEASRGAMLLSDGATLTGNWERQAGATQRAHGMMVAAEVMHNRRVSRKTIRLELPTRPAGLVPYKAFTFGASRFWPVFMRVDRFQGTGGGPRVTVYGKELIDDAGTLDTSTSAGDQAGGFGTVGPGGAVLTQLTDDIFNTLLRTNITVTTATIASGSQTTATINALGTRVWEDGDAVTIVDLVTRETYDLTADGDYVPGNGTLTFDSYTFPHDVKAGSLVFVGLSEALVRLIITGLGFRLSVEASELCTVNETIAAPTARTSLAVDGLNYDVADNRVFVLLRADGSASYRLVASSDQTASATTFAFDNGSGGSVAITCEVGDAIIPDASALGTEIDANATKIELRAYEEDVVETFREVTGSYYVVVDQASTGTRLFTDPLPTDLPGGAKIRIFYRDTLWVPGGAGGQPIFRILNRTVVAGGASQGADWIDVTTSLGVTVEPGSVVYYETAEMVGRLVTNESEIQINANGISINASSITTLEGDVDTLDGRVTTNEGDISVNASNIALKVSRAEVEALGPLVGYLDGSHGSSETSLDLRDFDGSPGAIATIPNDSVLAIRDGGDILFARARETGSVGESNILIEDPYAPGDADPVAINAPDGTPVFLVLGDPEFLTTGINIVLGTISMDTDEVLFKSGALLHNEGDDWSVSYNGFDVEASPSYLERRAYTIHEGGVERFALWHSTTNNVTNAICDEGFGLTADDILMFGDPVQLSTGVSGQIILDGPEVIVQDGDLELTAGAVILPGTSAPTTPGTGDCAIYFEDGAGWGEWLAYRLSGSLGDRLMPVVDTFRSDPHLYVPIASSDLFDDSVPQVASPTDLYLPMVILGGTTYGLRLHGLN